MAESPMLRIRTCVVVSFVVGVLLPAPLHSQSDEAVAILALARQAMGGDAALDAVRALVVKGKWTRNYGGFRMDSDLEVAYEAPDKFIRRDTRFVGGGGPMPESRVSMRVGLNGDRPIREEDSDLPFRGPPPGVGPQTPAARTADAERRLVAQRQLATQLLLPIFAKAPALYPLTLTAAGRQSVGNVAADVIEARSGDGFVYRLLVDTATHRPLLLTWMAKPIVVFSTSSIVTVGPASSGRGAPPMMPPPVLPQGDPTAGLPLIEYQLSLADYRTDNGLTWPRRLTLVADGKSIEETRVSKYEINPKIKASVFAVPD